MEMDSSAYESSNLVEFPKIISNSINTFKSNSLNYMNDNSNNSKLSLNKSKRKTKDINKPLQTNKIKEEFKLSLAKTIAKNKINNMNFDKLTTEVFNYKNKNISNKDPFNKYIKNFQIFNPIKVKNEDLSYEFLKANKKFLFDIKNINLKKKKKVTEKFLNFKKENLNIHNYYLSRMNNIETQNKKKTFEENIIIIQKNIRGFLIRSKLNKDISKLVITYIINNILKIQKAIRKLLKKKKYSKKFVVKIIKKERKEKANKITDILSMYHFRNEYKKHLIIKKILNERKKNANKIIFFIKNFLFKKKIKKIIELRKKNLEIIYPINEKNTINLKIYYNNIYRVFDFEFCQIRKVHVLYLNQKMIGNNESKNQYLCHFFVNGECVIDKRYNIIKNKLGIIYNLIEFKNKEKSDNILISNNNKNIKNNKFEKIQTKTIPYRNMNNKIDTNFNRYISFNKVNNSIDNKDNNNNSLVYKQKDNKILNNLNYNNKKKYINKIEDFIETKIKKNLNNNSEIIEINLEKKYNSKHNKIKSYGGDNYINSYNDDNNFYSSSNYTNIYKKYPYQKEKINENISDFLGNSSSTISNSNNFTNSKIYKKYLDTKNNPTIINEENKSKKNIKKGKKYFDIYY